MNAISLANPAADFDGRDEDHRGGSGGNGAESWVLDGTHNEMEREFRDGTPQRNKI